MTPQERGRLGAAVKLCRREPWLAATGRVMECSYPRCKGELGACWTPEDIARRELIEHGVLQPFQG